VNNRNLTKMISGRQGHAELPTQKLGGPHRSGFRPNLIGSMQALCWADQRGRCVLHPEIGKKGCQFVLAREWKLNWRRALAKKGGSDRQRLNSLKNETTISKEKTNVWRLKQKQEKGSKGDPEGNMSPSRAPDRGKRFMASSKSNCKKKNLESKRNRSCCQRERGRSLVGFQTW